VGLSRDEAIVLRTQKLGEADRIITLLTRGTGRVRAVAKGVRRTSSRFGSRLEPFTHVDLQLAEGREILDSTRLHRRTRLYEAMSDWTPAERSEFGRLLERFNAAVDRLGQEA
jgi:DNA repair protein RecO (recombination protein O)